MKIYALTPDSEEQLAVVTARTSRSPDPFNLIQAEVRAKGHVEFIKTNVLGYGHDSVAEVAQCPAIALEDISDLAANVIAIADPQLVVQMKSTRYQDMANCGVFTLRDESASRLVGSQMKDKYVLGMSVIQKILDATDHPRKRTLQCDMARTYLPAGISTQVAIRGNARVMRDATAFMRGHELVEVQQIGEAIQAVIKEHVEVLFDRHIVPAPTTFQRMDNYADVSIYGPGLASFSDDDVTARPVEKDALAELTLWRESGWRRRMRMSASPGGPYWTAMLSTDYGAYRDFRRNRTITQNDVLPSSMHMPADPFWAFRELYPQVCRAVEESTFEYKHSDLTFHSGDPYLAPMGSIVNWSAGGHIFNWAYALRLRSGTMCHPAYAIPMRRLMLQVVEGAPALATALGLVRSPKSLLGVEFTDRIPT